MLYNCKKGCMEKITVDESVPVTHRGWWDDKPEAVLANPNGKEAWVVLLEKAMAKMFGGYGELHGGFTACAFRAFTGEKNVIIWQKIGTSWIERKLLEKTPNVGRDFGQPTGKKIQTDDLFAELDKYDKDNYLMAASQENSGGGESKTPEGLVKGHAYSLLRVERVGKHRLLCLRNPWARFEWNGDWSDTSVKWNQHP